MKVFSIIICLLFFNLNYSQKEVGYFLTDKGENIKMYENVENATKNRAYHVDLQGDMNLTGEYIRYWTKDQKLKKFKQKNIEKLEYRNIRYMTLPIIKNRRERVHEIISENENYYLTNYYSNGLYSLYIIDKKTLKSIEERIAHGIKKEWDLEALDKLEPYFQDCPVLLEKIKYNIENLKYEKRDVRVRVAQNIMFQNINNFICE